MKKLIIIIFCLSIAFVSGAQCAAFIEGKEMQKGMYILCSNEGVENKKYVAQILLADGKSFTCRFLHSNSLYQFVDVRNVNNESKSLLQATVKSNVGGGFGAGTIFVLNVYMPDPDLCDLGNANTDKVLTIIATFNTDKKSYLGNMKVTNDGYKIFFAHSKSIYTLNKSYKVISQKGDRKSVV